MAGGPERRSGVFEQRVWGDRNRMVRVSRLRGIRARFTNVALVRFEAVISAHSVSSSDPTHSSDGGTVGFGVGLELSGWPGTKGP